MNELMTHTKKFNPASVDQLHACPVPESTNTYEPVNHGWLYDEVRRNVGQRGYQIVAEDLRTTESGDEFFGILKLRSPMTTPGVQNSPWDLSLGIRNTNNKRASAGIFLGTNVWVCDNLQFSAEHSLLRKHHAGTYDVLRQGIERITRELKGYREAQRVWVSDMQQWVLTPELRNHLLVQCLQKGAIKGGDIIPILGEIAQPSTDNPEAVGSSAWGLFNAITWIGKKGFDRNPETAATRSLSLQKILVP